MTYFKLELVIKTLAIPVMIFFMSIETYCVINTEFSPRSLGCQTAVEHSRPHSSRNGGFFCAPTVSVLLTRTLTTHEPKIFTM